MTSSLPVSGKPYKRLRGATFTSLFNDIFKVLDSGAFKGSLTSANINSYKDDKTLIQHLIEKKNIHNLARLLRYQNNINALSGKDYKYTALHYCLIYRRNLYFKLLLFHGASVNIKDSLGYSVSDYLNFIKNGDFRKISEHPFMPDAFSYLKKVYSDYYYNSIINDKRKIYKHVLFGVFTKYMLDILRP